MSARMSAGWSADLAREVYARLRELEEVAAGVRHRTGAELERVRAAMGAALGSWRRLLAAHAADEQGRCPRCRGWVLRRRWPCRVWTTAHHYLITSGGAAGDPATPEGAPVPLHRETGAIPGRVPLSAPNSSGPGRGLVIIARRWSGAR